jgi:hydroxyethylthiazole kinase-like uncharacterized protein yjeF
MLEIRQDNLPARLPYRPRDCNKGDFGAVGVVGGAPGMVGAALLAARGALACGAGRVYVGLMDDRVAVDPQAPELMIGTPERALDLPPPGCLVVGPGLGQSGAARDWLERALATPFPLLLDADALNLLARDGALISMLATRPAPTLITPHPGEAARLLAISTDQVQANRLSALTALSQRYFASVVLKGHASLVLGADGIPWRNTTGNAGMAAPGMGDVLCGIIAALAAQGIGLDHAAVVGVWLHGAAADWAVSKGSGPVGLAASEVVHAAREILNASVT